MKGITPQTQISALQFADQFGPISAVQYSKSRRLNRVPVFRHKKNGGVLVVPRDVCTEETAIRAFGQGRTDESGVLHWRLTEFTCVDSDRVGNTTVYREPVSFVATPTKDPGRLPGPAGPDAVILSTEISIVDSDRDVAVDIYSWLPSGESVGGVSFSYVFDAVSDLVIRID
jgi:hypothetical protein